MTMLLARTAMNVVRFLTHHPRRWASVEETPVSERQLVWETGIKLLEQHRMVQCNPLLKQFAWNAAYNLQWHAFIHVVDTLRTNPLIVDAEKAWQLIGNTYENNPDMVFDTKKPTHVAVGNLCLKAYSAREAASQNANISPPPTPEFILQLRQQREVAKAKGQARNSKGSQPADTDSHGQVNTRDTGPRPDASIIYPNDTLELTDLQQNTTSHPLSLTQAGAATEEEPFWFLNGFDNSHGGNTNDVMNIDLDLMLAQDNNMDDNATQPITWEQWDAWLADSNVMRPLPSGRDLRANT